MLKGKYKHHCEVPIFCCEKYLMLFWNDDAFDEGKMVDTVNDLYDRAEDILMSPINWETEKPTYFRPGCCIIRDFSVEEFIMNGLKDLAFEFDYIYAGRTYLEEMDDCED